MASNRIGRINEEIQREMSSLIRTVKDPRVSGSLLSIVRVDVTRDLSYATVFISSMNGMEAAREAVKGLKSAAGYMRRELGYALSLRHTPELRFVADDSIEYSAGIAATINRIKKEENV